MADPTDAQTERLRSAVLVKATRLYLLAEAPLGTWGELSEFGVAAVRPDYNAAEYLFGLAVSALDITTEDLAALVTADDVIRVGFQADPTGFPADRVPDVERCVLAAADWVGEYLRGPVGVA